MQAMGPMPSMPFPSEDSRHVKQHLLIELGKLKKSGIQLSQHFTMASPLDDIKFELEQHRQHMKMESTVQFLSMGLGMLINVIEIGNAKLRILDLDGWSDDLNKPETKQKINFAFERLYRRYFRKNAMNSPIIELVLIIFGSMFFHHAKRKFFGGGGLGSLFGGSMKNNNNNSTESPDREFTQTGYSPQNVPAPISRPPPAAPQPTRPPMRPPGVPNVPPRTLFRGGNYVPPPPQRPETPEPIRRAQQEIQQSSEEQNEFIRRQQEQNEFIRRQQEQEQEQNNTTPFRRPILRPLGVMGPESPPDDEMSSHYIHAPDNN